MSIRMGDKILSGSISIDELVTLIAEKLTDFDKNLLHKTGNEEKTNSLTINNIDGSGTVYSKSGTVDLTKTPTSGEFNQIIFLDKHGTRYGFLETLHSTNGALEFKLTLTRDNSNYHALFIGVDASGNPYTYAPTPANSSNGGNIATTKFVKSVLSSSSAGLATISKAQNGYCKFTNGLIIQWGAGSYNSGTTITFPTPFTMSTPSVQITYKNYSSINDCDAQSISKTSFQFHRHDGGSSVGITWVAIGY